MIEREHRGRVPAGLAAIAGALLIIAAFVVLEVSAGSADDAADSLRQRHDHEGAVLAASVLRGLGFLLFALPLVYLYRAAQARSERVARNLIGLAYAGPILTGVGTILATIALGKVADDFVSSGRLTEGRAEDLIGDSGLLQAAATLSFAGGLALVVSLVYAAIWAQRSGLLTPFWGAFAIVGAVFTVLPIIPLPGIVLFMLPFGMQLMGWWPGERPPAWEAGRAIPWQRPGDVEAKGTVEEEPVSPAEPAEDEAGDAPPVQEPAEPSRRKRKRRD